MTATKTLWRPVGLYEARLIRESGWRAFPPRLEHQPIFYPVLSREYAVQIARDWNTKDEASGYLGLVLEFEVSAEYLARFAEQVAGSSRDHRELWVPAEDLPEFNRHLAAPMRIVDVFEGERCAARGEFQVPISLWAAFAQKECAWVPGKEAWTIQDSPAASKTLNVYLSFEAGKQAFDALRSRWKDPVLLVQFQMERESFEELLGNLPQADTSPSVIEFPSESVEKLNHHLKGPIHRIGISVDFFKMNWSKLQPDSGE